MKSTVKFWGIIAFIAVIGFSMTACTGGGEKSINSADALKAYLDNQQANSQDKPIKVAMKINEQMVGNIREAINSAGKYVNLNLTGSPLPTIPGGAFQGCKSLVGVIIPNSVISIGVSAFSGTGLVNVVIPNSVTNIGESAFRGTNLANITIPDGVTYIGNEAFSGCSNLSSFIWTGRDNSSINGTWVSKDGREKYKFLNGIWEYSQGSRTEKGVYTIDNEELTIFGHHGTPAHWAINDNTIIFKENGFTYTKQ